MSGFRAPAPTHSPPNLPAAPAGPDVPASFTGPLALWLGVQLGVLALAACRVPLAASYPVAAEQLATHWVFGAQCVAGGMLFPLLLRDARSAVMTLAAALPFQLAAASLAGRSAAEVLPAMAFVHAWLATLALWATALPGAAARAVAVAIVNGLTLGGGLLAYLRAEFAPPLSPTHAPEAASPLLTTLATLDGHRALSGWFTLAGLVLAALLLHVKAQVFARKSPAKP